MHVTSTYTDRKVIVIQVWQKKNSTFTYTRIWCGCFLFLCVIIFTQILLSPLVLLRILIKDSKQHTLVHHHTFSNIETINYKNIPLMNEWELHKTAKIKWLNKSIVLETDDELGKINSKYLHHHFELIKKPNQFARILNDYTDTLCDFIF